MKRDSGKKLQARQLFGMVCQLCGYSRCVDALHFHHLDHSEKQEWSKKRGNASPSEVLEHPDRFQLVCANCHYEIHAKQHAAKRNYAECLHCKRQFGVEPNRIASGRDKYCSHKCQYDARKAVTTAPENRVQFFWERVQKTGSCWLWTGNTGNVWGYGTMPIPRGDGRYRNQYVHRFSYEMHHGPIPPRQFVKHTCENCHCVNPDHLYLAARKPQKLPRS
jgi:hypothetical protein